MSRKADILDVTFPMYTSSLAGQSCSCLRLPTILGLRHFIDEETVALRNYFTCLGPASELHRDIHSVNAETTGLEVWLDLSPSLIREVPLWQVHSCKNYFPEHRTKPWGYHGEGTGQIPASVKFTSHNLSLKYLWSKSGQG